MLIRNRIILRRPSKIEITLHGIATHGLRITVLYQSYVLHDYNGPLACLYLTTRLLVVVRPRKYDLRNIIYALLLVLSILF